RDRDAVRRGGGHPLFRPARDLRRQGAGGAARRDHDHPAFGAYSLHRLSHPDRGGAICRRRVAAAAGRTARGARLGLHRYRGDRGYVARRARNWRRRGSRPMTITLMLIGMIGLALLNVPIAVALGFVAMAAIFIIQGPNMLPNLALEMFNGASSFPLLAIPLFILSGAIMNASSISRRLIAFASSMVGFVRGGLSMVAIGTSVFFA